MRKLSALLHISLDASVGHTGEMSWIKIHKDVFAFGSQAIAEADTGIYGPTTFQMMEAHWPNALDQLDPDDPFIEHTRQHAQWYQKANKIVFSQHLKTLNHASARLINTNVPTEVRALKKKPGKNLMIFGSPKLVQSFLQEGLVDELLLTINPIILGRGIAPFPQLPTQIELSLLKTKVFENGVIGAHYACVYTKA